MNTKFIEIKFNEVAEGCFCVPVSNFADLDEKVAKMNRKAEKLGLPGLGYELTGRGINVVVGHKTDFDENNRQVRVPVYEPAPEIRPVGVAPVVGGFTFVAKIDKVENLVLNAPGQETPVEFRSRDCFCDHCKSNRTRRTVFVVRNDETGEHIQVGRNCLADFCRSEDPAQVFRIFEYLRDAMSEATEPRWPVEERRYSLNYILAMSVAVIKEFGFVSRAYAAKFEEGDAPATTSGRVWEQVLVRDGMTAPEGFVRISVEDEDFETAKRAADFGRNIDTASDYGHNVAQIVENDFVTYKSLGLAVSIVGSMLRSEARDVERKIEQAKTADSKHFGTVGKREVFTLTLTKIHTIDGRFGQTKIHRFMDENGNVATWFSSNGSSMDVGGTYSVKATVKKHDKYQGVPQTILSRAAIESASEGGAA
jgi:hypothetical protein